MKILNSVDTSTLFDVVTHVRGLRLKPIIPPPHKHMEITEIPKSQVKAHGVKRLPPTNIDLNINLVSINEHF